MRTTTRCILMAFSFGALSCAGGVALAQNTPEVSVEVAAPSIVVTGSATREVAADQAIIALGVVTSDKAVGPAAAENARVSSLVLDALVKQGVDRADLSTGMYSVQPVYEYNQQGGEPRVTGYRVENTLTIRTKRLDLAAKLIDAALAAGANRVNSVSFGLADAKPHRSEALGEAVESARSDALRAAVAAGVTLGPVRRIVIGEPSRGPSPLFEAKAMRVAADGAGGVPTELIPGAVEVTATVTLEYDIAPR